MDRVESALARLQWCWERYCSAGAGSRDGAEVLGAVQSLRRTTELLPSALLAPAAALLFAPAHPASLPRFVAHTLQPARPGAAPGWAGVAQRARETALALACATVQQLAARAHGHADADDAARARPLLVHGRAGRGSRACAHALGAAFAPLREMALAVVCRDSAAATRVLALDVLDTLYGARLPISAADSNPQQGSAGQVEEDENDKDEEGEDNNDDDDEEEEEGGEGAWEDRTGMDTPGADTAQVCSTADVVAAECLGGARLAQGVRARGLRLLGTLVAHYPRLMRGRVRRVLCDVLVATLGQQFAAERPDLQVIAGALTALRSVLHHPLAVEIVAETPEHGVSSSRKRPRTTADEAKAEPVQEQQQQQEHHQRSLRETLFLFVELGIEPPAHLTRYDVPKAALRLLAAHAALFRAGLRADHERVAHALTPLCVHANSKLRHAALDAQDAFLEQLSAAFNDDDATSSGTAAAQECFSTLFRRFYGALEASASTAHEVAAAVRGLGALAGMAGRFLSAADLGRLLDRLHGFFGAHRSAPEDALQHTARLAGAYARLAAQLATVDDRRVAQLEALVAALFRSYPQLHAAQRFAHEHALVLVLRALEGRGAALRTLLDRAVVPALVLSCCPARVEGGGTGPEGTAAIPAPLHAEYAQLWRAALRGRVHGVRVLGDATRAAVHGALVQGALTLLRTLDLRYAVPSTTGSSSKSGGGGADGVEGAGTGAAPLTVLVPVVPKDMDIFLNLVALLCALLRDADSAPHFARWAGVLCAETVRHATRLPLLSGFYKLLTAVLRVWQCPHTSSTGTDTTEETRALVRRFLGDVGQRLTQFRDELLGACLALVLTAPAALVAADTFARAVCRALAIGLSHPPLAAAAVAALARWHAAAPARLRPLLPAVLPRLDDFLLLAAPHDRDTAGADAADTRSLSLLPGSARQRVREMNQIQALAESDGCSAAARTAVQMRVLRFLGTLGRDAAPLLLLQQQQQQQPHGDSNSSNDWSVLARDPPVREIADDVLLVGVGGGGVRLQLHLDALVPRVVALAQCAADRGAKVAAGETLHALVTLLVGTAARSSTRHAAACAAHFRQVLPAVLALAVDADAVTQQLFQPLAVQLVHWLAAPHASSNDDGNSATAALLDALVDGVCAEDNSSARDFCARCLGEFVAWALRHLHTRGDSSSSSSSSSVREQYRHPLGVLERLYTLARQPERHRRLGAAVALHRVLVALREEPPLAALAVLETTHRALDALRLGHGDGRAHAAAADEGVAVLHSCRRVLGRYARALCAPDSERRCHTTLADLAAWLLRQAPARETAFRRQCLLTLAEVVPLLPQQQSPSSDKVAVWLAHHGAQEVFEGAVHASGGAGTTVAQCEHLTAALECLAWGAAHGMAPPGASSQVAVALAAFIESMAGTREVDAHEDASGLAEARAAAVSALFCFGSAFIERGFAPASFLPLSHSLYSVCLQCLFSQIPTTGGDDDATRGNCTHFLKNVAAAIADSEPQMTTLRSALRAFFVERGVDLQNLHCELDATDAGIAPGALALGCVRLSETGLLSWALDTQGPPTNSNVARFASHTLCSLFTSSTRCSSDPAKVQSMLPLLRLVLNIGERSDTVEKLVKFLQNVEHAGADEMDSGQTKGEAFYILFKSAIVECLARSPAWSLASLMAALQNGGGTEERNAFLWGVTVETLRWCAATSKKQAIKALKHGRELPSDRVKFPTREALDHVVAPLVALLVTSGAAAGAQRETRLRLVEVLRITFEAEATEQAVQCMSNSSKPAQECLRSCSSSPEFQSRQELLAEAIHRLLAQDVPLALKAETISILQWTDPVFVAEFRSDVHQMVTEEFPVTSDELTEGSAQASDYASAVGALCTVLERTASSDILQELAPVLRDRNNSENSVIDASVERMARCCAGQRLVALVEQCHETCVTSATLPQDLKESLFFRVVAPVLENMPVDWLKQWMCTNVKTVVQTVSAPLDSPALNQREKAVLLFRKTMALVCVRTVYDRLPAATIRSEVNPCYAGAGSRGNELTQALMKGVYDAVTEATPTTQQPQTALRYHTLAFAALAAVVLCTQTKEPFFMLFFKGSNTMWQSIVDPTPVAFSVETNFPTTKRTFLRSLLADSAAANRPQSAQQPYALSHYLDDSTLSEELVDAGPFFSSNGEQQEQEPSTPSAKEGASGESRHVVELELDSINANLAMPFWMRLVDHVASAFPGKDEEDLPAWESELLRRASSESSELPVRLFVTKMVLNKPHVFYRHAAHWMKPLMEVALETAYAPGFHYFLRDISLTILGWLNRERIESQQRRTAAATAAAKAKKPLDRLVVADGGVLVTRFINHLVSNAVHTKKDVIRTNIEIVRLFVEHWHAVYTPDRATVFRFLTCTDADAKAAHATRLTGVQLLGVLVANGFAAYDAATDSAFASADRFCEVLADTAVGAARDVGESAAEVCGMVLAAAKGAAEGAARDATRLETVLRDRLQRVLVQDAALGLARLHRVARHCPAFVRHFARLYDVLPRTAGEQRATVLELLKWGSAHSPELPTYLRASSAETILRTRDDDAQQLVLEIYLAVLPRMAAADVMRVLSAGRDVFPAHPCALCRQRWYEVAIWVHEHFCSDTNDADAAHTDENEDLVAVAKEQLVRGLGDADRGVRECVREYLHAHVLARDVCGRAAQLLRERWFVPGAERAWLAAVPVLLLHACADTLGALLFAEPLGAGAFREYAISAAAAAPDEATALSTPLFSARARAQHAAHTGTLGAVAVVTAAASPASLFFGLDDAGDAVQPVLLRATQAPVFEPTAEGGSGTGDSASIGSLSELRAVLPDRRRTALLFRVDATAAAAPQEDDGDDSTGGDEPDATTAMVQQQQLHIKRRFTPVVSTQAVIEMQVQRKKTRQTVLARQAAQRAGAVTVVRRYRVGEVPDVQIRVADVLGPLQQLLQQDEVVARKVFVLLLDAITRTSLVSPQQHQHQQSSLSSTTTTTTMSTAPPLSSSSSSSLVPLLEDEGAGLSAGQCDDMVRGLEHVLGALGAGAGQLAGALHETGVLLARLPAATVPLAPAVVGASAVRSGALNTGVLLLEALLCRPAAASSAATADACWAQLADLHRREHAADSVTSIVEQHTSRQPETLRALALETAGDDAGALAQYDAALARLAHGGPWAGTRAPTAGEVDFWEDARLACLARLQRWGALRADVAAEIAPGEGGDGGGGDGTAALFDARHRDVYLRAYVACATHTDAAGAAVCALFEGATPAQRAVLDAQYLPEYAHALVARGDCGRAAGTVRRALQTLAHAWAQQSPLEDAGRAWTLRRVQAAVEHAELLDVLAAPPAQARVRVPGLVARWRARVPLTDDVAAWCETTANRVFFCDVLAARLGRGGGSGSSTAAGGGVRRTRDGDVLEQHEDEGACTELDAALHKQRAALYQQTADACRKTGHVAVAEQCLRRALREDPALADTDYAFFRATVKLFVRKSVLADASSAERAASLARALQFVAAKSSVFGTRSSPLAAAAGFYMTKGTLLHQLGMTLAAAPPDTALDPAVAAVLGAGEGSTSSTSSVAALADKVLSLAMRSFSVLPRLADAGDATGSITPEQRGKLFMRFFGFCDDVLKHRSEHSTGSNSSSSSSTETAPTLATDALAESATGALLQAMRCGSVRAVERVPRLLTLLAHAGAVRACRAGVAQVPLWLFVPWVPQLVAYVGVPGGVVVAALVARLADAYPQAAYYAVRAACDTRGPATAALQPVLRRLTARLPLHVRFVAACELLQNPEHRLADWVGWLAPLFDAAASSSSSSTSPASASASASAATAEMLREMALAMVRDCLDPQAASAQQYGTHNARRAAEWRRHLEASVPLRDAAAALFAHGTVTKPLLDALRALATRRSGTQQPPSTELAAYSTWLAEYRPGNDDDGDCNNESRVEMHIEVPGQYDGQYGQEPRPGRHARVVGFLPRVGVLASLRCPKRLDVLADAADGRVRRFLVKGGEDLRLDARVEHTFALMGALLRRDAACAPRGLGVATYAVVPLTRRCGLIQWVAHTRPLKALVEAHSAPPQRLAAHPVAVLRDRWVKAQCSRSSFAGDARFDRFPLRALLLYDGVTRREAAAQVAREHALAPADALRRALLAAAAYPEAFLHLRRQYARSLAAFNICSYVLGIGDRHLDNFLLDMNSFVTASRVPCCFLSSSPLHPHCFRGRVVGIDFGHAFGTATQFLMIPELMPFRLTPQLLGVMAPDLAPDGRACGYLKHTMAHVLAALQHHRALLLDALDVFVQDPILNWDGFINKIATRRRRAPAGDHQQPAPVNAASAQAARRWFPQEKLAVVRRKLALGNPGRITADEVEHSVQTANPTLCRKIAAVAAGDHLRDLRGRVGATCLSVLVCFVAHHHHHLCARVKNNHQPLPQEQVECLMEQATDPHIMALTYQGWASWA